jgi:hypothetical protein
VNVADGEDTGAVASCPSSHSVWGEAPMKTKSAFAGTVVRFPVRVSDTVTDSSSRSPPSSTTSVFLQTVTESLRSI